MQSETLSELVKALVAAQAEFTAIPKDSTNPFFRSNYAGLPVVVEKASPILAKHGLAISQHVCETDDDGLITYLLHTSGEFIAHSMKLHLVKDDPQAQGSAITYARRYAYMAVLGLVADDDDDGNAGSNRQAPPRQQTQRSAPAPRQAPSEPAQPPKNAQAVSEIKNQIKKPMPKRNPSVGKPEDKTMTVEQVQETFSAAQEAYDDSPF